MIQDITSSYFTPINDTEDNCERTLAEIRIYPAEMTSVSSVITQNRPAVIT
jgi:hypothetical protein